jgi:hypothetical protein
MKCDLKLGRISAVLFLSLAVAGCGGGLSSSSMVPGGGNDGGGVNNGPNGGGGPGGMGGGPGGMGGGPGDMGGGPSDMGGGPGGMGGGPGSPSAAQADAAGPGPSAAQEAATSAPNFGSVTQSSNQDANGVTTDRASAAFSNDTEPRLVVEIARADGSTVHLDSATHVFPDLPFSTLEFQDSTSFTSGILFRYSDTEFTMAGVSVDWDANDATDYLASGYWLNVGGDFLNDTIDSAEIGAFVDGPEIRGTPTLPVTGTATYTGLTDGLYAAEYGTDYADVPEGSVEFGGFVGDIELTADFGAGNISGVVDEIYLSYVTVTPDGQEFAGDGDSDYRFELGTAPFGSDGTFTGRDVALRHPADSFDTVGSWGGRFSTVDDSDGNPRRVAGTFGGNATTAGGTTATFVGGFSGNSE